MPDTITTEFLALRDRYIASCFTKLNPVQQQAVFTTEGPLLILAGAGSGKTTVLVNRIANIIRFGRAYGSKEVSRPVAQSDLEQLRTAIMCGQPVPQSLMPLMSVAPARPWNVLAITFTNKAAGELKERLKAMLGDTMGGDVFASTFHSACVRILRRDAERIGFPKSFTIYDSDDQQRVIKQIYKELMIDDKFLPVKSAISQISGYKDKLLSAKDVAAEAPRDTKAALISKIYTAYSNRLRTAGAMDFDDLIFHTVQMLKTDAEAREYYQQKFRYVVVDEYQDTNALQDAIYFALAAPDASNLFFVGDIKQSIYRFRQADPSVFVGKQTAWQPYPADAPVPYPEPATIALDANFRSAPDVIRGINYFFETFFSRRLGGIDYGDGQRLVVGRKGETYPGLCELDVIREADTAADARTIAARIAQMMADGYPVRDAEPGKTRPCQYDDFCILLRGRSDFALYEAALTALEIPVYADVAADLLDAPHVRPFAALLRVLDNPAQDVELSSVLLSPLYPYTPDDLVQLRAAVRGGSLYAAVLHGSDPRFAPFLQDMEVYRELARTLTVGQLIEELFARTGYLAAVGAMPDGARCRDDLLAFAAWAANAGARGLSALVRAMDAAKAGSGVQAPSIGQSRPGCVSIMTVHRSKGLEFPVVFVANTSHKFNQSDAIYPVLYHKELGIGLMLRAGSSASRYKTLPYTAVVQTIKRETLSEEMRILYVALTRAQDALIITVPLKRPESELKNPAMFASAEATDAEAMLGAQNWALWLLTAAMLHPASEELWKYSELLPHHIPTEAPLNIRLLDPPPAVQAAEPEAPALPDDALTERLLEAFTWQSPNKALETIPVKVSVSAVTHTKQELTLRRPAFLQKSGMTGAERGTAIHAFLQSVPFGPQPPELEAEVQRQLDLHLLDPELAKVLDLEQVRPFFASGVWQRIAAARQILREEPFITALPAGEVVPEAAGQGRAAKAPVLVQGIADVVLVFDDHAEILDYKTDKSRNATYYIESYAAQLRLYRRAFALRLPVPVTKLTIYSFAMQDEIDIPLE